MDSFEEVKANTDSSMEESIDQAPPAHQTKDFFNGPRKGVERVSFNSGHHRTAMSSLQPEGGTVAGPLHTCSSSER